MSASSSRAFSGDECLIDSGSTNTILQHTKFFSELLPTQKSVGTISGVSNIIEGSGIAHITLSSGTKLLIDDALYSSKSRRNLLCFKDIRKNGYHLKTIDLNDTEYLQIISHKHGKDIVHEQLKALSSGLYCVNINPIESYMVQTQKILDKDTFHTWHDRLGHPGNIMMRRIINSSNGHPLNNLKVLLPQELSCEACSLGKLIIRPSQNKLKNEIPSFLERIQGDICGPINPPCGPFRYFLVLIDASLRWSHVSLLATRNVAFARLLAQIIQLRANFPPSEKIWDPTLNQSGSLKSTFTHFSRTSGVMQPNAPSIAHLP